MSSRVVVAMSGGVDSSTAALLLTEQGYEVIGVMMRLWAEPAADEPAVHNRCCSPEAVEYARQVADQLDIPFYLGFAVLREQYYGLMLALLLPCAFLLVPFSKNSPKDRVPWYDFILALLGVIVGLYLAIFYHHLRKEYQEGYLHRILQLQ